MIEITDDDMHQALDRIARTADGELLYRYLQKVLCAVTTPATHECALPRNEGRRSFAAELMGLMAEGMQASGRHAATVTFTRAEPRAISRSRGAARRVTPDSVVAGWNDTDTPVSNNSTGNGSAS